jgi:hypothetical protein
MPGSIKMAGRHGSFPPEPKKMMPNYSPVHVGGARSGRGMAGVLLLLGHCDASLTKLASFFSKNNLLLKVLASKWMTCSKAHTYF